MDVPVQTRPTSWRVGLAFVVVALVMVGALAGARLVAPFGDSDEGINAAVWASNSRALREEGPADSRLGGLRQDGTVYATHPPMIVLETALAESVLGEREWVSRLPAWLGTLAALGVLFAILRRLGVSSTVAGAATAAVTLTPMVWIYGSMLDTPVTSFAIGLVVVWIWAGQWRAEPRTWPVHPVVVGAVAWLAALSGWQATVLVVMCALTLLARTFRHRDKAWLEAAPFVVGGAVGLVLSLAWTRWSYGDFDILTEKFAGRSGSAGGVGLTDMVDFQVPWLLQLLGAGVIGVAGCVAALWNPRFRPVAGMSLAAVGVYAIIFRQAAAGHQYWNYWALLPAAVGFAFLFDRLARDAKQHTTAVLAAAVAAIGIVNLVAVPTDAADYIDQGHESVEAVLAAQWPVTQMDAWYVGQQYRPDAWLRYYTGLTPTALLDAAQLRALAADHPDELVVVLGQCDTSDPAELCRQVAATSEHPGPRVTTARELHDQLATS